MSSLVEGCTNELSINYNPNANVNNGSCIPPGTPVDTPTITTGGTTSVIKTKVTLNANIIATGVSIPSSRGFEYGTTTSYGTTTTENGSFGTSSFTADVTSLTCNTLYHYRAYATNYAGIGYGSDKTFTTAGCATPDGDTLYSIGYDPNDNLTYLYTLDPITGSILSTIGPVGYELNSFDYNSTNNTFYGVTGSNELVSINKDTGAGTLLGTLLDSGDNQIYLSSISFKSDGTLYGFAPYNNNSIYTIDTTSCDGDSDTSCLVTEVGETGSINNHLSSIAFDSNDNLYLFGLGYSKFQLCIPNGGDTPCDSRYYILAPNDGSIISTHTDNTNYSNDNYSFTGFTFNTTSAYAIGTYSGKNTNGKELITFDTETGITTHLGITSDMDNMQDLTFISSPAIEGCTHESGANYNPNATIDDGSCTSPTPPAGDSGTGGHSAPIYLILSAQNNPGCLPGYKFSITTGNACPNTSTQPQAKIYLTKTKNLKMGMLDSEVKILQHYLNTHNFLVSLSGFGSLNKETNFFGSKTKSAVILFQLAHKLKGDGVVGPITRGVINSL